VFNLNRTLVIGMKEELEKIAQDSEQKDKDYQLITGTAKTFAYGIGSIIKKTVVGTVKAGASIVSMGGGMIRSTIVPYAIPSFLRIGVVPDDDTYSEENNDINIKWFYDMGSFFGYIPLSIIHFAVFRDAYKDNPEILAIPIATNLISGIYESYRKTKKSLEDKI
jgi:hypothetical protein